MKKKVIRLALGSAALVTGLLAYAGQTQAQEPGKTIWDGVYTAAQAQRGEQVARDNCLICHAQAEWTHPIFLNSRSGRPIYELYEQIRMTMPYDAPGRLTQGEYADVVSYMLRLNSAPAGDDELPTVPEELNLISFTPPASP